MCSMRGGEPSPLETAFARYRETQAALRGRAKPELAAVDAALLARVELFRCLVEVGWQAPALVERQIRLDEVLVQQPRGALGG